MTVAFCCSCMEEINWLQELPHSPSVRMAMRLKGVSVGKRAVQSWFLKISTHVRPAAYFCEYLPILPPRLYCTALAINSAKVKRVPDSMCAGPCMLFRMYCSTGLNTFVSKKLERICPRWMSESAELKFCCRLKRLPRASVAGEDCRRPFIVSMMSST